jgi:hypothetical protein
VIDKQGIAQVLAKCAAYDGSRFPQPTAAMLEAWWEHFDQYPHVEVQDALEAVKLYYRNEKADVPRPAHISKIARQVHQDDIDRDPDAHAARLEARSNAKAGEPQRQLEAKVNPDPATAEHRRKVIEQFVAAKSAKAAVPPAE